MNFAFTEKEEALRAELRSYLDENLPEGWAGLFHPTPGVWEQSKEFCKEFAKNGWLTMAWPKEHGGQGATHWEQAVVREELWAHDEPRGPQYMNLNWIGPAIQLFGTEEQKLKYLPPISRGEVTWCQGFSEPNSGSDLASLQTKAVQDGDNFVINGQKIWTSYAGGAEICFLLARTDPDAPKHKGISAFLVDMETPGITVRPIEGMHGPHHFNEVYFDDVRVHRSQVLGEINQGWYTTMAALAFERVGVARYARHGQILDNLAEYAKTKRRNGRPLAKDPVIRQRFAELWTKNRMCQLLNYRVVSIVERGEVPNAEGSLARIQNTFVGREITQFGMELLGMEGELRLDAKWAPLRGMMEYYHGDILAGGVAAGTIEIQRNVVAERGLGLQRGT